MILWCIYGEPAHWLSRWCLGGILMATNFADISSTSITFAFYVIKAPQCIYVIPLSFRNFFSPNGTANGVNRLGLRKLSQPRPSIMPPNQVENQEDISSTIGWDIKLRTFMQQGLIRASGCHCRFMHGRLMACGNRVSVRRVERLMARCGVPITLAGNTLIYRRCRSLME